MRDTTIAREIIDVLANLLALGAFLTALFIVFGG
jgi:hypothetical protein